MMRSAAWVVLTCALAVGAHAQIPGSVKGKASAHLLETMDAGVQQDLIVVYDDKAIEADVRVLQLQAGLSARHQRIIEHKALRYAKHKQDSLSGLGPSDVEVLKDYNHLPLNFVRVRSRQALDRLLALSGVVGVFENRLEQKLLAESLPLIGQPQVAAQGNLGTGTTVAVLDTGVDYTKPAFGSCTAPGVPSTCKVVYAQDFAPSDGKLDDNGHGTNVAGIVAGVAPGAKIIALDVFGATGLASSSDILNAISWVIANKATYNIVAMNLSLGSGKATSTVINGPYTAAVTQARAAGILTVAAAGNDGYTDSLSELAATAGVVSVGAVYDSAMGQFSWPPPSRCVDSTSVADKVTCFSNSSAFLTLLAPGSQIMAAGITGSGTSQAAPHVAGAVAVLRAAYPAESLDQTVARLTNGVIATDSRNDIAKPRLYLPMALGVTPTACTYSVSEKGRSFDSNSGSGSIAVTTGAGCTWSAASKASDASWMNVTSGSSGSGNGTVSYSVAVNTGVASRTGTITVAGQTFTVTQSGSVGSVANILLNPGFEAGPVAWTDHTANGYPVVTAYLNPENAANTWYAWLCGYDNCADTIFQDITIPADAQSAYVQFNYWVRTDETSISTAYDSMTVRIYSPVSASSYKYWTLSNLNSTTGWVLSPQYDVSAYKGQTIRLQFSATTDASFATDFFVDNVNLMVTGATPDTQPPTVPTSLTAVAISNSAVNLTWTASIDNLNVVSYRVYRGGTLISNVGQVLAFRDAGLLPGTQYSYTVSACDAVGNCSAQSGIAVVTTPTLLLDSQSPSVPGGLTATPISTSAINLNWSPSTDDVGVTSYKIYRNGVLLTGLAGVTSYSDTKLTAATTYSYTVSACDAAGNCSAQSLAVSATTSAPFKLATPVVFSGPSSYQISGNTVHITVNRISNNSVGGHSGSLRVELWALTTPYFGGAVTGYITASIRTNTISGGADYLLGGGYFSSITLDLPYTAPPSSYSTYALFLEEYDATNCPQADHFCIIDYLNYHEAQAPTVPTGVVATATSSSQINLAWTASTDNVGVTTHRVYRNSTLIAILGNVISYSDIGLAASASYSYAVSACDAVGNCSAQSVAASATTQAAPDTQSPSVPTSLTATAVSSSHINLTWTASTDNVAVVAYKVYSSGVLVATLGNVTSSTRTNAPSTTYRYTVAACDAAGNCSAQSTPASATTPAQSDAEPPSVPSGLTATPNGQNAINLTWTAAVDNVGVTSHKVYREGTVLVTLGNVTSYGDTGLRGSTSYSYTVQACDASSNCSPQSIAAVATTGTALSIAHSLASGWNLLGNSLSQVMPIASAYSDPAIVNTVWKWDATVPGWQFYSPSMDAAALQAYAASKGYGVLSVINPGEGYWVNAKAAASLGTQVGTAFSLTSGQLVTGWNLVATGNDVTPSAFNTSLSATPPSQGVIPINLTTLWAWDNPLSQWYFYAPSLEANGGLAAYITGKGYMDFTQRAKTLGNGVGFWVNRP